MKLSDRMREALEAASRNPLRRVHDNKPGRPAWPANPNTIAALVRHGLLEHDRRRNRKSFWFDEWTLSDKGREALEPSLPRARADRPLYLSHPVPGKRGDYTQNKAKAIDDLETLDYRRVDGLWRRDAETARVGAQDGSKVAQFISKQRKAA